MSLLTKLNYNDGNNFATETDKVEFVGGKAQLKNLLVDSTFGANYNANINGSWGDGVLTGTAHNGASVAGGKLDLTGGTKQFVTYDAIGNADTEQTGCIRFLFTPNYITPVGESVPFLINEKYNSTKNLIFYRDTGSHHRFHIFDQNGNLIVEAYFGYKQWVQSQEYEIEFNFDINSGDIRMFIGGVQQGSTATGTGTRSSATIGLLQLGCSYQESTNANFKIDNFIVFDSVQHTADYTPGSNVLYTPGGVSITVNSAIECDDIDELSDFVHTASGSDNIRIAFDVDGVRKWWDVVSGWISSDGTYAQANDYADLTPAVLEDLLSSASRVKLIVILYSDDGSTTPTIESIIIYYDFGVPTVPTINKCIVYGFIEQSNGTKENIPVKATLHQKSLYNNEVVVSPTTLETTTDSRGYWELDLINNAKMQDGAYYDFVIDGWHYAKVVPNEMSKDFAELESPTL